MKKPVKALQFTRVYYHTIDNLTVLQENMVQILLFWRNMGQVLIHTVGTVRYRHRYPGF
jgi:hypothetical protein